MFKNRRLSRSIRKEACYIFSDKPCQQTFFYSVTRAEAAQHLQLEPWAPTRKRICLRKADCRQVARRYLAGGIWVCRSWHSYRSVPRDALQAARFSSTRTPSPISMSSPSTFITRGDTCVIKSWKGNRDGSCKVFFHVPRFVDHSERLGDLYCGVSTYQQHHCQEESHCQEDHPHHLCYHDYQHLDVIACGFNGTAWWCS